MNRRKSEVGTSLALDSLNLCYLITGNIDFNAAEEPIPAESVLPATEYYFEYAD